MLKRLFVSLVILVLCMGAVMPSWAWEWTLDNREKAFVESAESLYPGWRVTFIAWYGTGGEEFYQIILMKAAEGMLWVRELASEAGDVSGAGWGVRDSAPIPLTSAGAAKAAAALDAFVLCPARYRDADEFLSDQALLTEVQPILAGEGEKLVCLYPYEGYLAAVAENAAGQRSLRIAVQDGGGYGSVLATPMQEAFNFNEIHSTDGSLEIDAANSVDWLELGEDGVWRLTGHTSDEGRYFFTDEGLVDSWLAEYDPYYCNDAWHYGTPLFPTTLPDLVFTGIPEIEDAITQLDADGWACVRTEGAAFLDAPDGTVLASCFCRVPGHVLTQQNGWTQLRIGSEALGVSGWFRTEDLAFGVETENVICSFPSFDHWILEDTPFAEDICRQLNEEFWGLEFWLAGQTPSGDWLMLIDEQLVCTVSPDLVGETEPILHWCEDPEMIGPWDEEDE